MKSPAFWQDENSVLAALLAPLGWAYAGATAWRLAHGHPWKAPVPVICVGNLTAGGAGKTPIVRDLTARLRAAGRNAGILSRGYGGTMHGPLKVDPASQTASQVGDEPLLLARDAPCWVSRDRAAGARAMAADGIDIIVMDDGLQNPSLVQDLRIIVADGETGFGNGRAIPAGPLRETVAGGIGRADALIVTGHDRSDITGKYSQQINVLNSSIKIQLHPGSVPMLAFAGIGRPEKFRASLTEAGANITEFQAFADHHPYTDLELSRLDSRAGDFGAKLVTTEKDWVRLNPEWRKRIKAIEIDVAWSDEAAVTALLDRVTTSG